jgi:hypothetical protein
LIDFILSEMESLLSPFLAQGLFPDLPTPVNPATDKDIIGRYTWEEAGMHRQIVLLQGGHLQASIGEETS